MADTAADKRPLDAAAAASPNKKAKADDSAAVDALVSRICEELKESNQGLVRAVVEQLGCEKAEEALAKTHETEKGDGIMTAEGDRRKTPGGVFFHHAREAMGRATYNALCSAEHKRQKRERAAAKDAAADEKDGETVATIAAATTDAASESAESAAAKPKTTESDAAGKTNDQGETAATNDETAATNDETAATNDEKPADA